MTQSSAPMMIQYCPKKSKLYFTTIQQSHRLSRSSRWVEYLEECKQARKGKPWDFSPDEKPSLLLPAPRREPGTSRLSTSLLQGPLSTRPLKTPGMVEKETEAVEEDPALD